MLIQDEQNRYRIKDILRGFIGRYGMPVETVSVFTGIGERTIRSQLERSGPLPNAAHMAAYMRLFGPVFTNLYLGVAGQGAAAELTAADNVSLHSHLTVHSEASVVMSRTLEDRRVDHREAPVIIDLARHQEVAWQRVRMAVQSQTLLEMKVA